MFYYVLQLVSGWDVYPGHFSIENSSLESQLHINYPLIIYGKTRKPSTLPEGFKKQVLFPCIVQAVTD